MSIVAIYLAYLVISLGLTFAAGRALSRNGRMFLLDLPVGAGTAAGISNMLVAATSLLALGFIALTMRTTSDVATARLAIQLLAAKLGEVLLVLGALYLANIAILTRLRRRLRRPPPAPAATATTPATGAAASGTAGPTTGAAATVTRPRPRTWPQPHATWRPAPRRVQQ